MRVLSVIVEVSALPVFDVGHEFALRHAIALQLIDDKDAWYVLQTLQQPLEEAFCCFGIAEALHQDVEHDTILIYSAPEIVQLALNPDEDLVQVPLVAWARSTPAQFIGKARTELEAPAPDTLVGDHHAALGQDQLDVPETE